MSSQSKFRDVYFFERRGSLDAAEVKRIISHGYPDVQFALPLLPHSDRAEDLLHYADWLIKRQLPPFVAPDSLIVGLSLGGLIAAKLQELHPRMNLSVFSVGAPTSYGGVKLEKKMSNRVSLYSQTDEFTRDRCENWPELTEEAFDVPWLGHGVRTSTYTVCYLLSCYLRGLNIRHEVETLIPDPKEDGNEWYG
jgi:hypothetical protein